MSRFDKISQAEIDILEAIYNLPPKIFADPSTLVTRIKNVIELKTTEWNHSQERATQLAKSATDRKNRRDRDAQRAAVREDWARSNLYAEMVIKVSGTRDGYGLREVISVEPAHIVCRQLYIAHGTDALDADVRMIGKGNRLFALKYADQITTHGYDKVTAYGVDAYANGTKGIMLRKIP